MDIVGIIMIIIGLAIITLAIISIVKSSREIRNINKEINKVDNQIKELEEARERLYNDGLWDTLISDIEHIIYKETDVKEGVLRFDYNGRYAVFVAPIDTNHEKPYSFMYAVDEIKENSIGECALSSFNKEKSFALAEMLLDRDGMREELKTIIEENGVQ